ncbi:unnamed protein product [Penicillium roqueforti FM164]|uniref:Genomic scaffold, ProqFM164S02 n=1 Tax=Penicillium roqueforti (strain FM164) TaxID=1365484 RepID=W6Q993_PENRF|nr:unnamed protein product [Penicillium roqueforti FM164]
MVFTAFSVAGIGRCRKLFSVSDSQVLASAVRHGLVRGGYTDVHGNERYCVPYDACK